MTGSKNIYLKKSYPWGETRGDYVNIYISNRCVLREGWGRLVRGEREGCIIYSIIFRALENMAEDEN